MIKVEQIEVYNFEGAVRGMRNPLKSHHRSDTVFELMLRHGEEHARVETKIGKNDLGLMQKLYRAGTEHRKYLRQIFVSMDIIAPLYWWKEMDQYRINVTTNSCSTMHRLLSKPFEMEDFSFDRLPGYKINDKYKYADLVNVYEEVARPWIDTLNELRDAWFNEEDSDKKKHIWYAIIQLLPSSYNQRRTVTMNYENAVTIIHQRSGHKLDEWRDFCKTLERLPYLQEITRGEYGNTLITCKDCKHCKEKFFDDEKTYGKFCDISHIAMKSDDYCSKAVRRV